MSNRDRQEEEIWTEKDRKNRERERADRREKVIYFPSLIFITLSWATRKLRLTFFWTKTLLAGQFVSPQPITVRVNESITAYSWGLMKWLKELISITRARGVIEINHFNHFNYIKIK